MSAGVTCKYNMLYVMQVVQSLELKVKEPMLLEMDNSEAVDLANNWSVGGQTRHIKKVSYILNVSQEMKMMQIF